MASFQVVLEKDKYLTFDLFHTPTVFDNEVRLDRNHSVIVRIVPKYGR
jgi:hypothetical protein